MTVLKGGSQVFDLAPSEVLTISALGSGSLAYVSVESAIGTPPTISAAPVTGGNTTSVGPFTVQCSIKVYVVGRASVARGDGSPVSGDGTQTMVLDGDSITARYAEATAGTSNSSYFAWFNAYMQQAFTVLGCAAVSGQNSSQCLARFDANVAPLRPKWVSLMIGINNIGTPDQVIADIAAYADKVKGIGARLLLWTVLPSTSVAAESAKRKGWSAVNAYITSLATSSAGGIIVVPAHEAWIDSAITVAGAYAPVAAYVEDGTHPTALGAQAVGLYAYRLLGAAFRQRAVQAALAVPLGHREMVINPRANDATTATPTAPGSGTTLSGTLPAYWSASRESGSGMGGTFTVPARSDGYPGKQVRMAFSGALAVERCIIKAGNRGLNLSAIANSGSATAYRRYSHPTNTSVELIATAAGTFSATAVADTAAMVVGDAVTAGVQVYATEPIVVGGTYQAFAEIQFEAGGSGAVQPMLNIAVQDSGFANLLLVAALSTDGTSYGGITATQDTTPMLIATRPFVMPAGVAYLDCGVRLWSAAGASGAMLVKSISLVRLP